MYATRWDATPHPYYSAIELEFQIIAGNMALDMIKEGRIIESFDLTLWHVLYSIIGKKIEISALDKHILRYVPDHRIITNIYSEYKDKQPILK